MDDFDKKRLIEEKEKLEQMVQNPNYQNDNNSEDKEREKIDVTICYILDALIFMNTLILKNFSSIEIIKQVIVIVIEVILFSFVVKIKRKYPKKSDVNVLYIVSAIITIPLVLYMFSMLFFCAVIYSCRGVGSI